MDPRVAPRSRVVREIIDGEPTEDQIGERRTLNAQPAAKSVHKTISKDSTDQEALEGQRLVALQEKSELNSPLDSQRATVEASLAKFKQSFLYV